VSTLHSQLVESYFNGHVEMKNIKYLKMVSLLAVLLLAACYPQKRSPSVYEMPDGFIGWVCIEFERPDCEETPYIEGKWILKIPRDGYLCTSSKIEYGRAKDEYYYMQKGKRVKMPTFSDQAWYGGTGNNYWVDRFGTRHENTVLSQFMGREKDYERITRKNHFTCREVIKKKYKEEAERS